MILTCHGIDRTSSLESSVRDWAAELDAVYDRIARCDVTVEALPVRPSRYRVRLTLAVPGTEFVISRDPESDTAPDDPSAAVRDSFDAARRRLEHYVWRNQGDHLGRTESTRPG
jgi:ribosome-associated translation inhibitor RaiA